MRVALSPSLVHLTHLKKENRRRKKLHVVQISTRFESKKKRTKRTKIETEKYRYVFVVDVVVVKIRGFFF